MFAQKNSGSSSKTINEATRLFFGLADFDYEPDYNDHIYFQYLSNSKNDVTLLDTYHPNKIFDKYIVWVVRKGFTVVDHLFKIYGLPDTHECIDRNSTLHLVLNIDAK